MQLAATVPASLTLDLGCLCSVLVDSNRTDSTSSEPSQIESPFPVLEWEERKKNVFKIKQKRKEGRREVEGEIRETET